MSTLYTSVTITGYNASPPPDDGSEVSGNVVEWQKHLDKIGGPLKTAIESMDTNITAFCASVESDFALQSQIEEGFSAHKNGTAQTISHDTDTKVTFGTELYDTGSNYASSTFTAPAAGKYLFAASIYWVVTTTFTNEDDIKIQLWKNGALFKLATLENATAGSGERSSASITVIDDAAASDTYEIYISQDSGSNQDIKGAAQDTWWMAQRLA